MDPRNYQFGPWIEADRSVRVRTGRRYPKPSFYRNVNQRFWSGEISEGVLFYDSDPVGTSMTRITSYHVESDYYYGAHGTRVARQSAALLGEEGTEELGPSLPDLPWYVTRVDWDDATPRYVALAEGKMYAFDGDFATATPTETLDFGDYGGATPSPGLTQMDCDGYGRVWVAQYRADKSGEPWRVFGSTDYGKTWSVVFDGRDHVPDFLSNGHIHSVSYDPYDDWIIVTTGDVSPRAQTYVSYDNGQRWWPLFPDQGQIQATEAMTFPDHIVLGTDTYMLKGLVIVPKDMIRERVFRERRLENSEVMIKSLMNQPGFNVPFITASNQSCQHTTGIRPRRTTFVAMGGGDGRYFPVFASVDGYDWHEVARFLDNHIWRMMGPDSNGIVVGMNQHRTFAFKEPAWE